MKKNKEININIKKKKYIKKKKDTKISARLNLLENGVGQGQVLCKGMEELR